MKLSATEIESARLEPDHLQLAVQQIQANGYVVLESALPQELVRELHAAFMPVLAAHIAKHEPNRGANRHQMHLPFLMPFIHPLVISHPIALSVIDALLGEDCVCQYFASDTALPGSEHQPVHADTKALFPEAPVAVPVHNLVLNIPLVDFREDNGPLEIWPGGSHWIPAHVDIKNAAPLMHSERLLMSTGSVLIRDNRMWHRGTPNRSTAARPTIALIYARHWMKAPYPPIEIPRPTYDGLSERAKKLFRAESIIP